jgi:hypothetical protein
MSDSQIRATGSGRSIEVIEVIEVGVVWFDLFSFVYIMATDASFSS